MMHQSQPHAADSLGGKLIMTLVLGLLLNAAWRWTSATHARRSGNTHRKLPRPLQTWEGEGGRPSGEDDHEPGAQSAPQAPLSGSLTAPN